MTFLTRSLRFSVAWTLAAAIVVFVTTVATGHTATTRAVDYVTVHKSVALPDAVLLPPGEYVFEALRPDLVRVSHRPTREVLFTGFTVETSRLAGDRDVRITLGEAPEGQPAPIDRWFPSGRSSGHQFIYR